MLSKERCPSLQGRGCCCIYWKTGKPSQQCPLSEIKRAAGRGAAAPVKSCIYSLVIKNHFINLVLSLNLYSQVLMSSVAMNEQYLTLNLRAAVQISSRKMLTAVFLINEGSCNAISAPLRHLTRGKNILQNLTAPALLWWNKVFSAAFRKATCVASLSGKHLLSGMKLKSI